MKRTEITVPKGIRYLSEWEWFSLDKFPNYCILNKQIPGCGFTEYCINGPEDIILCSPRKLLLENKKNQHVDDTYLVVNEMEEEVYSDKNLSSLRKRVSPVSVDDLLAPPANLEGNIDLYRRLYSEIRQYCIERASISLPRKILVTYDSYRLVKSILEKLGIFQYFYTIIDEMQSVLGDARFKPSTEIQFMKHLMKSHTAIFVSATPILEDYLDMLEDFKDLPYFELNWEKADPSRVIRPNLSVRVMRSAGEKASTDVIQPYLNGEFKEVFVQRGGEIEKVVSTEAVLYVNSVDHIIAIIKRNNLTSNQVNIICAKTDKNIKKIQRKLGKSFSIGSVPKKGEPHKMFTICTRTTYLGVDMYSECARTFIFSDSNIDCLAVDIAEDLPQILGRQRNDDNPWKNSAVFYYRTTADYNKMTIEDFDKVIEKKKSTTESLLRAYDTVDERDKQTLAINFEKVTRSYNYKDDYVSVDKQFDEKGNCKLVPTLNKLVLVNEIRAFRIQQIDYRDRFSVFAKLEDVIAGDNVDINTNNGEATELLSAYIESTTVSSKLKLLCESNVSEKVAKLVLGQINDSDVAKSLYLSAGPEKCKSLAYNSTKIKNYLGVVSFNYESLKDAIYDEFSLGEVETCLKIKERLARVYKQVGYNSKAKATDIKQFFQVKPTVSYVKNNNGTRKQVKNFELIRKL